MKILKNIGSIDFSYIDQYGNLRAGSFKPVFMMTDEYTGSVEDIEEVLSDMYRNRTFIIEQFSSCTLEIEGDPKLEFIPKKNFPEIPDIVFNFPAVLTCGNWEISTLASQFQFISTGENPPFSGYPATFFTSLIAQDIKDYINSEFGDIIEKLILESSENTETDSPNCGCIKISTEFPNVRGSTIFASHREVWLDNTLDQKIISSYKDAIVVSRSICVETIDYLLIEFSDGFYMKYNKVDVDIAGAHQKFIFIETGEPRSIETEDLIQRAVKLFVDPNENATVIIDDGYDGGEYLFVRPYI